MKIFDIDGLFEKFMREQMKADAGKYTEDEWEDRIPVLYEQFGKTPLSELGGKSAEEYYASFTGDQLCKLLAQHVEDEVPVSDFLCTALVEGDTEKGLKAFLKKGTDEELTSYAVNVLADKGCTDVLPLYITFVTDPDTDDNMREIMGDVIVENANAVKEQLLATVKKAKVGRQYIIEALSNCERDERIFAILSECFRKTRHLSAYAHMLVKYGDERAVDLIKERIEEPSLRYADFTELKYAIEALGGEYDGKRDFSNERTYKKIKGIKS